MSTSTAQGPAAGSRLLRGSAGLLLGIHGALLLLSLPVLGLMVLGSLWEGGDQALKHRLLAWGLLAGAGGLAAGVLLICAATAVLRAKPGERSLLAVCSFLLVALAAGWAWVFQGILLSDTSTLGMWSLLTLPGLVAALLVRAADAPDPSARPA